VLEVGWGGELDFKKDTRVPHGRARKKWVSVTGTRRNEYKKRTHLNSEKQQSDDAQKQKFHSNIFCALFPSPKHFMSNNFYYYFFFLYFFLTPKFFLN
jgi:hypothetical protein